MAFADAFANECYKALRECHKNHCPGAPEDVASQHVKTSSDSRDETKYFSGPTVARLFSAEAARTLTEAELRQLIQFLKYPQRAAGTATKPSQETPGQLLQARLAKFAADETRISEEAPDRIASPGGPADADLGLILHIQSEDETIEAFWDPRSATIALLQEKGLSGEFVFGYDWHWRADQSFKKRQGCPTSSWKNGLKAVHDKLSADVLSILPLPFTVTASSCARESVRRCLSPSSRHVNVVLAPESGDLRFDLDFHDNRLRRIFVHVHHPVAGFFVNGDKRRNMGLQVDAGLNFALWLVGRKYEPSTFTNTYSRNRAPCSRTSAPLADIWSYTRREETEARKLRLEEYASTFLTWASRYIQEDPIQLLFRGESVAAAAANKLRSRISSARTRFLASRAAPRSGRDNHRDVSQLDRYDPCSQSRNRDIADRSLSAASVEMDAPRPMDDFVADDVVAASRTEESSPQGSLRTFHGQPVTVLKGGTVKLGSARDSSLSFRTSTKATAEMMKTDEVRIYFSDRQITLRCGQEVLYTKPIERLLTSSSAAEWLVHLMHELDTIRDQSKTNTSESEGAGQSQNPRLQISPHVSSLGGHWKAPELRNKLLHGAHFEPTQSFHQSRPSLRVYFRGVALYVPPEANPRTVFIQCYLAPEGSNHPSKCIFRGQPGDPACRLGILITYKVAQGQAFKREWVKQRGDCNVKKFNS